MQYLTWLNEQIEYCEAKYQKTGGNMVFATLQSFKLAKTQFLALDTSF